MGKGWEGLVLLEVQAGKGSWEKLVPNGAHGNDITSDVIILD